MVKLTNWPGYVGKQSNTMQSVSGYKVYVTTSFLFIRLLGRRSWYHLLEY